MIKIEVKYTIMKASFLHLFRLYTGMHTSWHAICTYINSIHMPSLKYLFSSSCYNLKQYSLIIEMLGGVAGAFKILSPVWLNTPTT